MFIEQNINVVTVFFFFMNYSNTYFKFISEVHQLLSLFLILFKIMSFLIRDKVVYFRFFMHIFYLIKNKNKINIQTIHVIYTHAHTIFTDIFLSIK